MAVSLSKGGKVSLAKVAADAGIASLNKVRVGLGWDINQYDTGAQFDLDASAFLLNAQGKCANESAFIFYNNKVAPGINHLGDNRTGAGEGDDETILVTLSEVSPEVEKIKFVVTIDQADIRQQNFGMVPRSYIRLMDDVTGTELVRVDLGEDFNMETALELGALYRYNGEWKFEAIKSGFAGGLAAMCRANGLDVE